MDARTYEIIIEVLTDKVDLLGWQLKNAEEEKAKLKAVNTELGAINIELKAINDDLEETVKHINETYQVEGGNKNA